MAIKVGINGFGRIGRLVFRAALQRGDMEVVAINDPNMTVEDAAYLLKYDTTQGTLPNQVGVDGGRLVVDGVAVQYSSAKSPAEVKWSGVEYVCESSGKFLSAEAVQPFLDGGARKVILCAPAKDASPMFVYGVNHRDYQKGTAVLSNASCTTNCLAPLCKVLQDNWGIANGLMTTVHASTATQNTVDGPNKKDRRRGRAAAHNIFPTSSGAAKAVALVVPGLKGKMTGMAVRIPPTNGSLVDLNVILEKPAAYADICAACKKASQEGDLKGVLGYTDEEWVSVDVIRNPCSGVFDERAGIQLTPTFFKLVMWYDNEWGYSMRWTDLAAWAASQDA